MPIENIEQLQIDIIGPCNLRCPTCLIGCSTSEIKKAFKGLMTEDTLTTILDKIKLEAPNINKIAMHNWTEPLLHPRVPELISIAKQKGFYVYISSNLNVLRRVDDLMGSGLDKLAVSISGWEQERYGVYHKGGNIAFVKDNMLSLAKANTQNKVELVCIFHRYIDNRSDERIMQSYAQDLNFNFVPIWAYFTAIEKILASQSQNYIYENVQFNAQDEAIAQRLAIPIATRLKLCSQKEQTHCIPLTKQLPIDPNGYVRLCCASGFFSNCIEHFSHRTFRQIQKQRETHKLCNDCNKCGIPNYYHPNSVNLDEIGNIAQTTFENHRMVRFVPSKTHGRI